MPERHSWLRHIRVAFVPGSSTVLLDRFVVRLLDEFVRHGHIVQEVPEENTDLVLTTARLGEPLDWRQALLFTVRRRFRLKRSPTVITLMHATTEQFERLLNHFERALAKPSVEPEDYQFPGLVPEAWRTLTEQGKRGGAILALMRVLQAQAKSIRLLLVVGDDKPLVAYHFDLVGSYPRSDGTDPVAFYEDIVLRIVTTLSTREATFHRVVGEPIPRTLWMELTTPAAMVRAARELGERRFFTEAVVISNLVRVPVVSDVIASQYSEGCFATWEPRLDALITTVTGSARPIDKWSLTEEDLAVVVGVRPDGLGAEIRQVEGHRNDPPSSEAFEMMLLAASLPQLDLPAGWGLVAPVPAMRSNLHGHRGVFAYDPQCVEFVPLDPPYYYYPVSCATDAQAWAIRAAFLRSETLSNPSDSRAVVFTILPGHGVVLVEKWVLGKQPFQVIWEMMDTGQLQIASAVPQGPMWYERGRDGKMYLRVP